MPKVKAADFRYFQRCFEEFMTLYELHAWKIGYALDSVGNDLAKIIADPAAYIATVYLNAFWDDAILPYTRENVRMAAGHEALHLLLMRLTGTAQARFVSKAELDEAEEEVVRKLEHILS